MKITTAMYDSSCLSVANSTSTIETSLTPAFKLLLKHSLQPDDAEQAASFGRWWLDTQTEQWILSMGAAQLLDVTTGLHDSLNSAFSQVVSDDLTMLGLTHYYL